MKQAFCSILVAVMSGSMAAAETIDHEGATYWIYRLDPQKEKLELFLGAQKGKPHLFPDLERRLNLEGRELKFAVNAGIFEPNFRSTGLHIAEGKTITGLNLKDFKKDPGRGVYPQFLSETQRCLLPSRRWNGRNCRIEPIQDPPLRLSGSGG